MADFAHRAALSPELLTLDAIKDYDLYCHYVAGLVGEGLSRLFSASGKEPPFLAHQLELSNSLGMLLQKTNIIRDFREDAEQQRFFWPREIWGSAEYGPGGQTPTADIMQLLQEPQRAKWVQSAMVVDALRHACDALDYLRLLRNQSVFNFAAIPATMAIATLDLCFMNSEMFERNIKIRKARAAEVRTFSFLALIIPDSASFSSSCAPQTRAMSRSSSRNTRVRSTPRPPHPTQAFFASRSHVPKLSNGQSATTPRSSTFPLPPKAPSRSTRLMRARASRLLTRKRINAKLRRNAA